VGRSANVITNGWKPAFQSNTVTATSSATGNRRSCGLSLTM
jgi:hypothetical protein